MKVGDWVTPDNETGWAGLVVKVKYLTVKDRRTQNIFDIEGKRATIRIPTTAPIIRNGELFLSEEEHEKGYFEDDIWINVIVIPKEIAVIINS